MKTFEDLYIWGLQRLSLKGIKNEDHKLDKGKVRTKEKNSRELRHDKRHEYRLAQGLHFLPR